VGIYSGKVLDDGKVLVLGALLPKGTKVTILVAEDEEPFDLSPDMIAELEESIAQADRGETIPADVVLAELDEIVRGAKST
jgi:hypothetical protein